MTGSNNTFVGQKSGASDTSDPSNTTALGYSAIVSGAYSTALGSGTQAKASGAVAIGRDNAGTAATTTTTNEIKLGTALHTTNVIGSASIGGSGKSLGFFGATPAAKPTGVAVDAAGIHAALVSLGLIAA